MHLLFTGGDSGGALTAGLAVAARLSDEFPARSITFAGSDRQVDRGRVSAGGFGYLALRSRRPPQRLSEVLPAWFANRAGYRTALAWIDRHQPGAMIALGGDSSLPAARAALRRRVPLALVEPELVAGTATRRLASCARAVCTAFSETRSAWQGGAEVHLTGAPVRDGLVPGFKTWRQVLILGGTEGGEIVDHDMPRALCSVKSRLTTWRIVHQTVSGRVAPVRQLYDSLGLEANVVDQTADLPQIMADSELAIARVDGVTLAELAAAGVPAILLPAPSEGDRERLIARRFADRGGCAVVDERKSAASAAQQLAAILGRLLGDLARRLAMAQAMSRLARPEATAEVAAVIARLAFARRRPVVLRRRPQRDAEPLMAATLS